MSTSITDYGLGHPKSWEDVLLKKFENHLVIIMFTGDCLHPFGNIVHPYQYIRVTKRSTIRMGFMGIWFLFVSFPSLWHLSQLLHMIWKSLKSDGQVNLDCKTFMAVFWEAKWPPQAFSWQWLRIPCCSSLGTHFLMIWSAQYLKRRALPNNKHESLQRSASCLALSTHLELHQ